MIASITKLIVKGFRQLRLHTSYLLVAFLLIVLPALFLWVTYTAFDTAYQSINTAEKRAVNQVHNSIESLLKQKVSPDTSQNYLTTVVAAGDNLQKAKILHDVNDELIITQSTNREEIGLVEGATELYLSTALEPENSFIYDFSFNGVRTWQAFRQVRLPNDTYYIFTEHTFADIDAVMTARQQQAYLALPVIFIFLMLLAYWLLKQTEWQRQYVQVRTKLDEQMLFTNSVAHELRAPLTAIRGYISFLRESENLSSDEHKYAENVNTSSERLIALINDFLEVARIQSGKLALEFSEADVRTVLKDVQAEFTEYAKKKDLELKIDVPQKPVLAMTDTKRLQQVLTNLVSNAIKYTDKGSVTLSLTQTRRKTIIAVKDTGHGISAEDQQKLFQAFTRVGHADKSGVTGTGLGMWITKQLVGLLHGTVTVESIEGIGTHVKLTFDV